MSLDRNQKRLTENQKDEAPSRRELIRDFDKDMYATGLKIGANSTGSEAVDKRLEKNYGELRTGEGFGRRPTNAGIVEVEDVEAVERDSSGRCQ